MKKLMILMLILQLVVALVACGVPKTFPSLDVTDEPTSPDVVVGGWTTAESPVVTDEVRTLLKKATENLLGVQYTPVAYVASQVVAGTNHLVLCRIKPVLPAPNAIEKYALAEIYEDLQGNATLTEIVDSGAWTYLLDEPTTGGWYEPETPELTDELRAAFIRATENYVAAKLTPLALVSEQVVAGKNYRIFCEVTPNLEAIDYEYAIVNVYVDLDGNATWSLIEPFGSDVPTAENAVEPVQTPVGDPIAPAP